MISKNGKPLVIINHWFNEKSFRSPKSSQTESSDKVLDEFPNTSYKKYFSDLCKIIIIIFFMTRNLKAMIINFIVIAASIVLLKFLFFEIAASNNFLFRAQSAHM